MRIVTLATCHNRREKTLSALNDLYAQELPESVNVEHVLVDDGSTDGTAAAVAERFPDVEIVPGAGKLFWAGGMRYGWEQAVRGKMFDYLLVYNDDVRLETSALQQLLETSEEYGSTGASLSTWSQELFAVVPVEKRLIVEWCARHVGTRLSSEGSTR